MPDVKSNLCIGLVKPTPHRGYELKHWAASAGLFSPLGHATAVVHPTGQKYPDGHAEQVELLGLYVPPGHGLQAEAPTPEKDPLHGVHTL